MRIYYRLWSKPRDLPFWTECRSDWTNEQFARYFKERYGDDLEALYDEMMVEIPLRGDDDEES